MVRERGEPCNQLESRKKWVLPQAQCWWLWWFQGGEGRERHLQRRQPEFVLWKKWSWQEEEEEEKKTRRRWWWWKMNEETSVSSVSVCVERNVPNSNNTCLAYYYVSTFWFPPLETPASGIFRKRPGSLSHSGGRGRK